MPSCPICDYPLSESPTTTGDKTNYVCENCGRFALTGSVEDRDGYLAALEAASVESNIAPFVKFIAERVQWSMQEAA